MANTTSSDSDRFITLQAGFAHMGLIVIVVAALVAGTGVYVYGMQQPDESPLSSSQADNASLTKPLPADLLTVGKVRELAAADKPGVAIRQIELETEGSQLLYKVHLADGSFVLYNARSGVKVTKESKQAAKVERDASLPADFSAGISVDKARQIALARKPGGQIRKIEVGMEHGVAVYSVRFTDDARIDVTAADGRIVRTEPAKTQSSGQPAQGSSNSGSGSSNSGSGSDDGPDSSGDDSRNRGPGSSGSSGSSGSGSGSDD